MISQLVRTIDELQPALSDIDTAITFFAAKRWPDAYVHLDLGIAAARVVLHQLREGPSRDEFRANALAEAIGRWERARTAIMPEAVDII